MSKLARGLVHDADFAEELVQETWLRSFEASVEHGPGFIKWAQTTMRRLVVDRWRADSARNWHERDAAQERLSTTQLESGTDPRVSMVAECIARLSKEHRSVLEQRYIDGLTLTEIAERAGEDIGAVRSRHRRAIIATREALDARHENDRLQWAILFYPALATTKRSYAAVFAAAALVLVTATTTVILVRGRTPRSPAAPTALPSETVVQLAPAERSAGDVAIAPAQRAAGAEITEGSSEQNAAAPPAHAVAESPFRIKAIGPMGHPVADANVFVAHTRDLHARSLLGTTNAQGELAFAHERSGFWACVESDRFSRSRALSLDLPIVDPGAETQLLATLAHGPLRLAGTVSGPSGAPLEGALVTLKFGGERSFERRVDGHLSGPPLTNTVVTDDRGQFDLGRLTSLWAKSFVLVARHPARDDLAPTVRMLKDHLASQVQDIVLETGSEFAVELVDERGDAFAFETCRIRYGAVAFDDAPTSGERSALTFTNVGETATALEVTVAGGALAERPLTPELIRSGNLRWQVPDPMRVSLTAVDQDGATLAGWRIAYAYEHPVLVDPIALRVRGPEVLAVVVTGPAGAATTLLYPIRPVKAYLFPPDGPLEVATAVLELPANKVVTETIVAGFDGQADCTLTGRLVPHGGRLPDWITVDVDAERVLHGKTFDVDPNEGTFTIDGLPPGAAVLRIAGKTDEGQVERGIELQSGEIVDIGNVAYSAGRSLVINLSRADGTALVDPVAVTHWFGRPRDSRASAPKDGVAVGFDGQVIYPEMLRAETAIELVDARGAYAKLLIVTEEHLRQGELDISLPKTSLCQWLLAQTGASPTSGPCQIVIVSEEGELLARKHMRFSARGECAVVAPLPAGNHRVTVRTADHQWTSGTISVSEGRNPRTRIALQQTD